MQRRSQFYVSEIILLVCLVSDGEMREEREREREGKRDGESGREGKREGSVLLC